MSQALTLNQIIEVIRDIAQRHYMINSFFLGKEWDAENQTTSVTYPLLQVYPETSRLVENQYNEYKVLELDMRFRVLDLLYQDIENKKDIESDTLQICQDIVNEINRHPYYRNSKIQVINTIQFNPINESGTDFVAGREFTLTFKILNYNTFCGLPFDGIPGFSIPGIDMDLTYNTQFLTCETVTACTTLQNYIQNEIDQIPVVTADTSQFLYKINTQDDLDLVWSAGAINGFSLTNNNDGSVTIGTGTTVLRTAATDDAPLESFTITGLTTITLTDNSVNYIFTDYNGGNPIITADTSVNSFNCLDKCLLYKVTRQDNTVYYIYAGEQNIDSNKKLRRRFLQSENLFRANGLLLGNTNRYLNITTGRVFFGLTPFTVNAFDTSTTDTFTQIYSSGSTWIYTTGNTQINNTEYNNSGVLTTMSNNRYRVDYVYFLIDSPDKVYVLLGDTQYNTLAQAELSTPPSSVPVELQHLGLLIGRVIIQYNASDCLTQSAFQTIFTQTTTDSHNQLNGLQGGTTNEYYHLTQSEYNQVQSLSGLSNTYVPYSGATQNVNLGSNSITTSGVTMAYGSAIKSTNGGGKLELDGYGLANTVYLTNDNGVFNKSYLSFDENIFGYNNYINLVANDTNTNTVLGSAIFGVYSSDISTFKSYVNTNSNNLSLGYKTNLLIMNNTATTSNTLVTMPNAVIGSTVNAGYTLDVNGTARFTNTITRDVSADAVTIYGSTSSNYLFYNSNTFNIQTSSVTPLSVKIGGSSPSPVGYFHKANNSGNEPVIRLSRGYGFATNAEQSSILSFGLPTTTSVFNSTEDSAFIRTQWEQNSTTTTSTQYSSMRFGVLSAGVMNYPLSVHSNGIAVGQLLYGVSPVNAHIDIASGTTSNAQIHLRSGVAPTSPNDGDIWYDAIDLKLQTSGITTTVVSYSGSATNGQTVVYSNGTWVPGAIASGTPPAVNLFNYYNFI